jgi:hypothetical protein
MKQITVLRSIYRRLENAIVGLSTTALMGLLEWLFMELSSDCCCIFCEFSAQIFKILEFLCSKEMIL